MAMRDYRKGNWTVEETMILIEAKKKDDERRKLSRSKSAAFTPTVTSCPSSSSSSGSKPITELRWKWVEEYCWGKGCFRSQNQCNDKWDNLMRDYKKVRDYQKNYQQNKDENIGLKSYWDMDKIQRKDKGLPTNMLAQIYQALSDVVERSIATSTLVSSAAEAAQFFLPPPSTVVEMLQTPSPLLPSTAAMRLSSPRLPPGLPQLRPVFHSASEPPPHLLSATLFEPDTSEHSQQVSPLAKKRRREEGGARELPSGAETLTPPPPPPPPPPSLLPRSAVSSLEEVSSAISRSATLISERIQANEEREERRHREMMNLQESRLRIEESRLEINRQSLNNLTDAINRLASSIFNWANSQQTQHGPP